MKGEVRFIGYVKKVEGEEAEIEILNEYREGLRGIEDFSHLIILYWFHLRDSEAERRTLLVFPKRHRVKIEKGVFACRSPSRPNPIGFCVVKLLDVKEGILTVKGLDAFKDSPVIDIKPYLPETDSFPNAQTPEWVSD